MNKHCPPFRIDIYVMHSIREFHIQDFLAYESWMKIIEHNPTKSICAICVIDKKVSVTLENSAIWSHQ